MGLIKAITGAVGGSLADQWLEVIEPANMGEGVVFTKGQFVRKDDRRSSNTKGTIDTVSNGSIIHVYDNQFMILVDGGKIVDFAAEPGMYKVDDSSLPSLFAGQFKDTIMETFKRFKFGGVTPYKQMVFYINTQEIKGIKFGTKNPINYFDNFYNAELFVRTFGTYSIRVVDPILFYKEAIPRDANHVHIDDINEQYLSEFLEALQATINKLSADGQRISYLPSKGREVSKYMADTLDEDWKLKRGILIESVGLASISYDEDSEELIKMRSKGAMLSDATIREGYVQGTIAEGIKAAGENESGSGTTFMGMGMGMNAAGGFLNSASETNREQMNKQQTQQASAGSWTCTCGSVNSGNFCSNCGSKKVAGGGFCSNCGNKFEGQKPAFCPNCGQKQ